MIETIGRPERPESSDNYRPYIDLVPDGDIRFILEEQHRDMLGFLRSIPASHAMYSYAADKWSVAEVLGHVNDNERLFTMRAFWFGRGHTTTLPTYESDAVVKISRAAERPWDSLIDEFDAVRRSTVAFFRYLPDDAWLRRGFASDMPFTPRALAFIAAGHVEHHRRILQERYL